MAETSEKKGRDLVWKLAELQRPFPLQVLAMILFAAILMLVSGEWSLPLALLVSMILHELGHGLVFERNAVKTELVLIFPLGAVAKPIDKKEDAKSNKLTHFSLSWLLLAGPAMNVALLILGRLFTVLSSPWELQQFGENLVYINTFLVVSNFLPIWKLDAGLLTKVTFASLDEDKKSKLSTILSSLALFAILSLLLATPQAKGFWGIAGNAYLRMVPLAFIFVAVVGVGKSMRIKDVSSEFSGTGMSFAQSLLVLIAYFLLLAVLLFVI